MASASFMTDLIEIATQAAEAAAGVASIYSSFKLLSVARSYYDLYRDQKQYYYDTFQSGLEAPLSSEVYAIQKPTLDYAKTVLSAYNPDTGPLGGQSGDPNAWWSRHAAAYGLPRDARLQQEMSLELARVKSDWTNYLFRFAETYYDLENDIRWKKRLSLHNIGIKTGTAVSSALQGSLGTYQQHVADFSGQLATFGNGIARKAGYVPGQADTRQEFDDVSYTPKVPMPDYNSVNQQRDRVTV